MALIPRTSRVRMVSAGLLGAALVIPGRLAADQESGIPARPDAATIAHVLNRIGFGPRPGDVTRVERMGLPAYIDEQLHPERIDDSMLEARLASFETLTMSSAELSEQYFQPAIALRRDAQLKQPHTQANAPPLPADAGAEGEAVMAPGQEAAAARSPRASLSPDERQALVKQREVLADLTQAKMLRAVMSERQLQEVLDDFWLNHFNVFVGKGQVREYLTAYDRDAIRPHVLGHFRDLLGAVAHSPAMLFYLDNWESSTPTPPTPPGGLRRRLMASRLTPEQRDRLMSRLAPGGPPKQTRGINENYGRELMELHTLGVDSGYTQDDVIALARILTGWTIDRPRQGGSFIFRPGMHDTGTKTLLGVTFRPDGENEGERALDLLAMHPATAHHISYELAQRFVADDPPAALVERAAKRYLETRGDIREVVRTIITSPEFFASAYRDTKIKTPLEFVASAARATGATIVTAQPLVAAMQNLGMPLFGCQPPTGYSMTADAWVNTGALLNRMNFAVQLVNGGRIPPQARGRGGALPNRPAGAPFSARGAGPLGRGPSQPIRVEIATLAPDTGAATQDAVIAELLAGRASPATRQTLARAGTPQNLIALALGSPEFQHR